MIESKTDYLEYLRADKVALNIKVDGVINTIKELIFPHPTWSFQKKLRKVEFYGNCKRGFLNRTYYYFLKYRFMKESVKLGMQIPENVFGPGWRLSTTELL